MSNGKGQTPRKGYNWAKYAANYDGIFRKTNPAKPALGAVPAPQPMKPQEPTP